jgi:hypothetical protein
VQHLQHAVVGQGMPAEFAAVGPGAHPQREQQALLREGLDGGAGRAGAGEGRKQVADGLLHAQVGIQDHPADGVVHEPDRQGIASSPRRALASWPPRRRALSRCNSASLMAPLRPKTSRSLNEQGSYRPSSSRISVVVSAQISSSRCQSALLRASLETSKPSTMPARPMPTSATSRWKPSRPSAEAPERPRSSSITITCSAGQPNATARWRSAYWRSVEVVFSTTWRRVDWRTYR